MCLCVLTAPAGFSHDNQSSASDDVFSLDSLTSPSVSAAYLPSSDVIVTSRQWVGFGAGRRRRRQSAMADTNSHECRTDRADTGNEKFVEETRCNDNNNNRDNDNDDDIRASTTKNALKMTSEPSRCKSISVTTTQVREARRHLVNAVFLLVTHTCLLLVLLSAMTAW